tara:strand:- start:228 stop:1346 length:1119 start_codon:yes stop_codon:yes gene_type:complete
MKTDRITSTLVELCEIPSPSGCERHVADYILSRISALGLDAVEDNAGDNLNGDTGNIIVRVDGNSSSSLLLTAHMDTVMPVDGLPDRINVNITDGIVHTDQNSILGADDKAGIAIALELLHHRVETSDYIHSLEIVFTVQEEIGARGAAYLNKESIRSKRGFVLDGDTPVGTVIVSAPHKLRYDLVVRGTAAHAALEPEKGINAIKAMSAIVADLPCGKIDSKTVTNYGIVKGGNATNVIPDRVELIGELRGHDLEKVQYVQKQIDETPSRVLACSGASAEIVWTDLYPGYSVSLDELCIRYFASACKKFDVQVDYITTDGGGDANPLNGSGIICVPFGLGMKAIHTNQENIKLADLYDAFNLLLECVSIKS